MTMQLVRAMDKVPCMMTPKDNPSEVKEYLREVRHIHLRTEVLCARAEKYREMASRATGRMDAVRVSGTPGRSKVEQYVLELVDMHDDLQKEIKRLTQYTQKAEKLIQQLPDERYRAVHEALDQFADAAAQLGGRELVVRVEGMPAIGMPPEESHEEG